MFYVIDTAKIPIAGYRELLKTQNLLPSRRLLLDGIDAKFAQIQSRGIATVADLLQALSSPAKIAEFAKQSGVSADYLKILRREAGTLKPKRVPLQDFPDVDSALIERLLARNIKTAKDYLESEPDGDSELYCLCTLSQINGVGPNAARMLYEAGYRSPAEVAAADADEMLARLSADNASHKYYQGTLGLKDMRFCLDMAKLMEAFSAASR